MPPQSETNVCASFTRIRIAMDEKFIIDKLINIYYCKLLEAYFRE